MSRIALSVALVALAGSAAAQGMPMDGAWTGPYAGATLGGAFGETDGFFALDSDLDGDFGDDFPAFTNETGDFDGGGLLGAQIGYDRQFGNVVVGGVFDYASIDASDFQTGRSATPADYTINRELDAFGTLRGRVGYVVNDRFLVYGTAGAAFGRVEDSFVSDTGADVAIRGGGGVDSGYAVGAGVETMIRPNLSLGVEYLYANLGSSDYTVNLSGAPGTGPGTAFSGIADSTDARGSDRDFDFGTLAVRINYRF